MMTSRENDLLLWLLLLGNTNHYVSNFYSLLKVDGGSNNRGSRRESLYRTYGSSL